MMPDYTLGDTLDFKFTTRAFATGVPTVLAGTPVIEVYEDNSITQIVAGETLTVDFDGVVGLNNLRIVATGANGYETGKSYAAIISVGTVGGVSVVGEVVAQFSIERSPAFARLGAPAGASVSADVADVPTVAEFDARTLVAASYFDPTADTVALVTDITTKTGFSLAATGLDAIVSTATGMVEIAKAIWDRVLTGATHNINNSAGRKLRQIEASFVITAGTAQAGAVGTITLAAGESATNDIFAGDRCVIVAGTGVGEHGIITAYNGTTKVATMSQNWVITPDVTSEYELTPADVDVETWQHVTVANSATTALPEVDAKSISDSAAAADAVTEVRLAELDAGNLPGVTDGIQTDLDNATDGLGALKTLIDAVKADTVIPAKNVAFNNIPVFMVDGTDHVTPKTGLTLGVTRSIDGGAFGAGTGTAAEIANGAYQYDASQADMNGDIIIFRFTGTAADDVFLPIVTK